MKLNHLQINLYLVTITMLMLMSCKDNTSQDNKDAISVTKDMLLQGPKDEAQLKNKIPLNKQKLEDSFPLRIGNYRRDFQHVSEDMATTEGAFGDGKIYLKIVDSYGPIGGSIITTFNALYDLKEEMQPATIIEKKLQNGTKTVNRYETDTENSSIEFIYQNRFHVLLTAKKMTTNELWNLFEFDSYLALFAD